MCKIFFYKNHFSFLLLMIVAAPATSLADEIGIDLHYCYSNSSNLVLEGRVLEIQTDQSVKTSDSIFSNIWRTLKLFINDEEENTVVQLIVNRQSYFMKTDEEGYFSFDLDFDKEDIRGITRKLNRVIRLKVDKTELKDKCAIFTPPFNKVTGIISDFDDTVIVSDVINKGKLLLNVFTKNYKQREVVAGMATYYEDLLSNNSNDQSSALFFITGSPRQIQSVISKFLDFHNFPSRTIITKKVQGDNRDPLLDQHKYKYDKIVKILSMLPDMKFVLIGDDGEKDPEVYFDIQRAFPDQVKAIWIRQVNDNLQRKTYAEQQYFVDKLLLPR